MKTLPIIPILVFLAVLVNGCNQSGQSEIHKTVYKQGKMEVVEIVYRGSPASTTEKCGVLDIISNIEVDVRCNGVIKKVRLWCLDKRHKPEFENEIGKRILSDIIPNNTEILLEAKKLNSDNSVAGIIWLMDSKTGRPSNINHHMAFIGFTSVSKDCPDDAYRAVEQPLPKN